MSCPRHDSGLVCQASGAHRDHAAWVNGGWVFWSEPEPPPSPFRTRRPASKDALMETVRRLETPAVRLSAVGGPSTSAAAATNLRTGSQKYKLLHEYASAGSRGLTDEEAAINAGLFSKEGCCWWHRSSDLRVDKFIVDTGMTRVGRTGDDRMVCKITELGEGVLDASR